MSAPASLIKPMLASAGRLPPVAEDEHWAYEMKWDGVRAIVYVSPSSLSMRSRNDLEISSAYPELAGLSAAVGSASLVLDAEVVGFDSAGKVSFAALQQRMHVRGAAAVRAAASKVAVSLLVFDVLSVDGSLLLDEPYERRRDALDGLGLRGSHWDVPPVMAGLSGAEALQVSQAQGLEGIMVKRRSSPYQPGRRSADWVKVKNFATQEVVIAGWKAGSGRRAQGIGSLLLGVQSDAGLVYVGNVGTGFTAAALSSLEQLLEPLVVSRSPFAVPVPTAATRDVTWVAPSLVGEVEFGNWTPDGRLRHPSWRGLRPDKSADDVVVEALPAR